MLRGLPIVSVSCVFAGLLAVASVARAADEPEAKPNTLTKEEKKAGWKLLFDGKSLKGWRGYKMKKPPAAWKVSDGLLTFENKAGDEAAGGGDLITQAQYDSFELTLDWRISAGGNSGVMYHVSESEDRPWKTGPEMQILDNQKHKDGKSPLTSAGACYGLYPPTKDLTRPVGEWNSARLVVEGMKVEHWLNGEKVVEYELWSDDWKARVAKSKFKDMPKFGTFKKGPICLQDHSDRVEFRNIKIRAAAAAGEREK